MNICCHDYGSIGHLERNCHYPGGGAESAPEKNNGKFSGVDRGDARLTLICTNDPRDKTLVDGTVVYWCGQYGILVTILGPHVEERMSETLSISLMLPHNIHHLIFQIRAV